VALQDGADFFLEGKFTVLPHDVSRDISVTKVISRFQFTARTRTFFSSPPRRDRRRGSPSFLSDRYPGDDSGIMWTKREADHSPPSGAEVRMPLDPRFAGSNPAEDDGF
jgi:hypothetical protein